MKAIILVAGVSRRLFPLTEHRPKCLLEVAGKTILDHQLEALRSVGVREVCLVLGYRREQIREHAERRFPDMEFSYRINHHFFETNTSYSLWTAGEEFLDRDFYYLNGDVFFEPDLLARLEASPTASAFAVEKKRCGDEEVKVVVDGEGRIQRIGKELDPAECAGEFIGVARIGAFMTNRFFQALDQLAHEGQRNVYFETALDMIAPEVPMHMVDVTDMPCIEIDFPEDYERARTQIADRLRKKPKPA
ncbi:MAG: phosphocholine cytidylyltransferase family protein [Polyangiales bacterium]